MESTIKHGNRKQNHPWQSPRPRTSQQALVVMITSIRSPPGCVVSQYWIRSSVVVGIIKGNPVPLCEYKAKERTKNKKEENLGPKNECKQFQNSVMPTLAAHGRKLPLWWHVSIRSWSRRSAYCWLKILKTPTAKYAPSALQDWNMSIRVDKVAMPLQRSEDVSISAPRRWRIRRKDARASNCFGFKTSATTNAGVFFQVSPVTAGNRKKRQRGVGHTGLLASGTWIQTCWTWCSTSKNQNC